MKVVYRYLKSIWIFGILEGMACYADQPMELFQKINVPIYWI